MSCARSILSSRLIAFSVLSIALPACRTRAFNVSEVQDNVPAEPNAKHTILSTGPRETVVWHYARANSQGIDVAQNPGAYLESKLEWGRLREEGVDTETKAGAGLYTAHDPVCAIQWGGPKYKNQFTWFNANREKPTGSNLFLISLKPGIEVISPMGGEENMGAAISSRYPIVLGGACASFTMRDHKLFGVTGWRHYSLHQPQFRPVSFGAIVTPDEIMRSGDVVALFEGALKNWFAIEFMWYSGTPSLRNTTTYLDGMPSNRPIMDRIADPEFREYELPLLAALTLIDINTFSPKLASLLKERAKSAADKRYEKGVKSCLAVMEHLEKTSLDEREIAAKCPYYALANRGMESLLNGFFGPRKSLDEFRVKSVFSLMEELERLELFTFSAQVKSGFTGVQTEFERTHAINIDEYRKHLERLYLELVTQYWNPGELNNVKRYLYVLRKFVQLNSQVNALGSSRPVQKIATPEKYGRP